MLLFSAATAPQGDPVALAMVLALAVVIAVMAFRKHKLRQEKTAQPAAAAPAPVPQTAAPLAPGSAGRLKLHNVPPKTAAMVMAIVADRLGKPLNELRFISIKEVSEDEV